MSKKYLVREISDKEEWENYLLSQSPNTFLHSWNWGETNRICGYKVERLGIYRNAKLCGLIQLIYQPAKRGHHFIIPGGPLIDYDDSKLLKFTFSYLRKYASEKNVWFVRIRPDVRDSIKLRKKLKNIGFIPAPMHLHGENTLILDITKGEDEILKGMRKTTRYLIRKSLKENYRLRISTNEEDIDLLYKLQEDTVKKHKFVGFPKSIFQGQLKTFSKDKSAELFICERNGMPLVAAIVIYFGEKAFYHHSGSSLESTKTNASYFTQWQIILRAKKLGYKYYDFWGIAPTDDPKHRFSGVTIFKKGFGGVRVDWLHAHDLVIKPFYWITYTFESVRRIYRGL